ncbi:hypothetical protein F9K91_24910 [Brucella tritici]|uniref:DUF1640 domain-containing protein n=1 Tax=Brucella tritici TaxID=94626 RepID=A0A833CGQ2_9HYPH|nr:hypothetical protein [Brucella tritici]KAB2661442.1 hypothetical protein F9K91_24910 [Brucella tritici]
MAQVFDSMAYAAALERQGFKSATARALAETTRDHVVNRVATKDDIENAVERAKLQTIIVLGGIVATATGILLAGIPMLISLIK